MLKILKPDFSFSDDRGLIVQLIHEGYKQINVITSKKNVFRGNHYHKVNSEAFYIVEGKLKLTIISNSKEEETAIFSTGDFFAIDAYDIHSFFYLEDTVLVTMYSEGAELPDGTKDIFIEGENK